MKKLSLSLFSIILFSSIINSAISFEKIIIGKANVTDGDTIKINDQKIRLFGIDAPETKQFCKEVYLSFLIFNFKRDYKCGEKSTNALKKKIKDKKVRCLIHNNKDRYRRNIGICYLKKQDINCIICTSNKECISLFENVQDIFYAPIYNIFAWVRFFIHHQVTIWHSFNHNKLKPWQSGIRFLVQYITKSKPILVRKKVSCQSASELVDY